MGLYLENNSFPDNLTSNKPINNGKKTKEIIAHWLKETSPFIKKIQNDEDRLREAFLREKLNSGKTENIP